MTSDWAGPLQQGRTGADLGEQIRADVQRALEQAQRDANQARSDALRAAQDADAAAQDGSEAAAEGAATGAFRVTEDGRLVPIGEEEAAPGIAVTVQPDQVFVPEVPPEAVVISIAFFVMLAVIAIGWPLARAFARRMDRQPAAPPALLDEQRERLTRIEQAVDAMSIEVERISEGQRFVTKLLTERALPEAVQGEAEPARRADPLPVRGERR